MGLLDRFERKLEEAVGDAFARLFRSEIVPQEIQAALQRAAGDGLKFLDGGYALAPNYYVVTIGASDHERLTSDQDLTERVFARHLGEYITEQGWQTCAGVRVRFEMSDDMYTGQFRATGSSDPDVDRSSTSSSVWPMPGSPNHDNSPNHADSPYDADAPANEVQQQSGEESMTPQSDVVRNFGRQLFGSRRARPHDSAGYPSPRRTTGASAHNPNNYYEPDHGDATYDDADFAEETYFDQTAIQQPPRHRPSTWAHQPLTAVLELSDGSGRTLTLRPGATVIGRGQEAQFRVPDTGVSRRHAEIRWDGQLALVSDLKSTNGTTVNGSPITVWQLADGDVIRVGHSEIIVRIS
ncbi:DUF3662 and FHA domain-containing protein [Hoyosella rhizosphaerae]|uniref:FHA domain-containing protein n=1 Tax=Hoyosella rhizosphaerae TaxID=1755582 RepID=A0A916U915_9ACTN|nr:DUF3662 and FHA domain-containing protein [Hoyosella rhizosphaerae]MBN4927450.1 DUF3662 and FHA domain-containing protein [Hoyosella rhizosphaerae]GGC64307.1 hypothetical protein GCM10011410_16040 [Hoyosella rhizosphaerae]